MRFACRIGLLLCFAFAALCPRAQSVIKQIKVAVFVPLYLDQVFDGDNFKTEYNNALPKTMLPGLEFYNGIMLALDSLKTEKVSLDVHIYDSKAIFESINNVINEDELNNVSLIVASFNDRSDIKPLAAFALKNRIPLISSTFPNDGGIINNPYFILLNSSLKTHLEELYKFMQRNYSTSNIIMFRRKGAVEDMIQSVFSDMAKTTFAVPLKMKTIQLTDAFTNRDVLDFLDSTKRNIVVCGTINETFGLKLIRAISSDPVHAATVVGMPTWDSFKNLDNSEYKGVEIVYSSPYNFSKTDKTVISITQKYRNKFLARPSDMVFKGFESMYHFSKLVLEHKTDLINFLSEKKYHLFNDFDIKAVRNKNTHNIDYLENRKLYFIKKVNGSIKAVY